MIEKQITPSILNVEKNNRQAIVNKLLNMGIKWFHFDVMDNQFVPNTALEVDEIISLQSKSSKKFAFDVHLMVENPWEYAKQLIDYATCITVHYESFKTEKEIVDFVNEFSHHCWIGIAIKPSTKFEQIQNILYLFDLVLIMGVEPGFGGQTFIDNTLDKVKEIKEFIDTEKLTTLIQVDGGINDKNSKSIFEAGSTFNVVGSYLIKNIDDSKTLDKLK